jgi:hypothetical protein
MVGEIHSDYFDWPTIDTTQIAMKVAAAANAAVVSGLSSAQASMPLVAAIMQSSDSSRVCLSIITEYRPFCCPSRPATPLASAPAARRPLCWKAVALCRIASRFRVRQVSVNPCSTKRVTAGGWMRCSGIFWIPCWSAGLLSCSWGLVS